jgi:hypothetical protein
MDEVKKVINIFPDTKDPVLFLKQLKQSTEHGGHLERDKPASVVVAIKLESGSWYLGYCNAGFGLRIEAMSRINVDVIDMMIQANADRYGLHSHD